MVVILSLQFNQGCTPASRSVGANIPTNPAGGENCVTDPDETIRRRLEKLKSDDSARSSNGGCHTSFLFFFFAQLLITLIYISIKYLFLNYHPKTRCTKPEL